MQEFHFRKRARKILGRWPQIAGSGAMREAIDLTIFAIFAEGCQKLGPGVYDLPAGPLGIKISGTFFADIIRAIQHFPAGFFAFPKT